MKELTKKDIEMLLRSKDYEGFEGCIGPKGDPGVPGVLKTREDA